MRQITSPCRIANQPSVLLCPRSPGIGDASKAVQVGQSMAPTPARRTSSRPRDRPTAPPHHARSAPVAKHHALAVVVTPVMPAAWAQASRHLPASRFAAARASDSPVEREPVVQPRVGRIPGHRGIVRVACRDQTARPRDPPHLAQDGDRIGHVLEHLVCVDDVERAVGKGERGRIGNLEHDVARVGGGRGLSGRVDRPPPPRRCRSARAGATMSARSMVMVPGPHPTSSSDRPGWRCGSR